MPQGKRKQPTPPGTRLGTHKDKTKTRMAERAKNKRIQTELEEAREQQRKLDARIASEKLEAERLDARRLARLKSELSQKTGLSHEQEKIEEARHQKDLADLKDALLKREIWPLSEARNLIRDGYTLESTIKRTGWPSEMLEDVRPGEW